MSRLSSRIEYWDNASAEATVDEKDQRLTQRGQVQPGLVLRFARVVGLHLAFHALLKTECPMDPALRFLVLAITNFICWLSLTKLIVFMGSGRLPGPTRDW
jgi:hypothetical protein